MKMALVGIPYWEARIIATALDSARAHGLDFELVYDREAACAATIVVVNGDDPGALRDWRAIRNLHPEPIGFIVAGPAQRTESQRDEVLHRPLAAAAFTAALDRICATLGLASGPTLGLPGRLV